KSRAVQVLQAFRQFHRDALGRRIDRYADGARERDQQTAVHYQQAVAAAIVPGRHPTDGLAGTPVHHFAADQIALEVFTRIERRALGGRDAHLAAVQALRIGDGVDAAELENQRAAVKPG